MTEIIDMQKLLEKFIDVSSSKRFYDGQFFYDQAAFRKKKWLKVRPNQLIADRVSSLRS